MPEDSSSVDCVPLERNSLEFNTISDNFCKTSQAYICSRNIATIFRIENPKLLKSYLAEKTSMQIAAGKDGKSINELELFRGVHPNSVSEINKNGFSAAIADVNCKYASQKNDQNHTTVISSWCPLDWLVSQRDVSLIS